MRYRITHKTVYTYAETVTLCHNEARLSPRHSSRQQAFSSQLWINPMPSLIEERTDFFNNRTHYFIIQKPHKILTVTAVSDVKIHLKNQLIDFSDSPPWEEVRDCLGKDNSLEGLEARGFVLESPFISLESFIYAYALDSFTPQRPLLEATSDLTSRIYNDFMYDPNFSTIATPLLDVFKHKRGVCQDFAHFAIACLRSMRLPARYVSGYLETLPPPGQPKLQGVDASHAWFSVYTPQQGWSDFDPTNNQTPTSQYIITAWGRDYSDVTPVKGVIFGGGGGEHLLDVSVDVERLN